MAEAAAAAEGLFCCRRRPDCYCYQGGEEKWNRDRGAIARWWWWHLVIVHCNCMLATIICYLLESRAYITLVDSKQVVCLASSF